MSNTELYNHKNNAGVGGEKHSSPADITQDDDDYYTMEYSCNFHRHIVKCYKKEWRQRQKNHNDNRSNKNDDNNNNNNPDNTKIGDGFYVCASYPWLDEARQAYPQAQPVPLAWPAVLIAGALPGDEGREFYASRADDDEPASNHHANANENDNQQASKNDANRRLRRIRDYLQTRLAWYPGQFDQLLQNFPSLRDWPLPVLQERIEFFLAPMMPPPSSHYDSSKPNATTDVVENAAATSTPSSIPIPPPPSLGSMNNINADGMTAPPFDWPVQFYNHGYGAGMSLAQVTHGLLTMPHVLLRCYYDEDQDQPQQQDAAAAPAKDDGSNNEQDENIMAVDKERRAEQSNEILFLRQQTIRFYQETPSVVLEMTRKQLSYFLQGASSLDCSTYSYLHWKGWDFDQLSIILQALPPALSCSDNPSWDILERSGSVSALRSRLLPEFILFWQVTFQMRPMHIQAMLKTHPGTSCYSAGMLQNKTARLLQGLQILLPQLREIYFQMPSLLGMSGKSMQDRLDFWNDRVLMTSIAHDEKMRLLSQSTDDGNDSKSRNTRTATTTKMTPLADIALRQPSLLQYSVPNNLQPKLDFFANTLKLNQTQILTLTKSYPRVWGLSLERKLMPMANGLARNVFLNQSLHDANATMAMDQALHQVGQHILSKAPLIFLCHWEHNIRPKVECLLMAYGSPITRQILAQTPWVLQQSLDKSLLPKMTLLTETTTKIIRKTTSNETGVAEAEKAVEQARTEQERISEAVKTLVSENPSLLLIKRDVLKKRLDSGVLRHHMQQSRAFLTNSNGTVLSAVLTKGIPLGRRKKHRILCVSSVDGTTKAEFHSVKDAAIYANVSTTNMYFKLRKRKWQRWSRSDFYVWSDELENLQRQVNHSILCVSSVDGTTKAEFHSVKDAAIYANVSTTLMYSKLRKKKWQRFSRSDFYIWSDELENLQRQVNQTILCVSSVDGTTKAEFCSVKDAAIYANVSTTHMYSKLRKKKWQRFSRSDFYIWSDELENLQRQVNHTILCVSSVDGTTKAEFCSVKDAAIYANVSTTSMYSKLRKRKWQRFSRSDFYVWSDELENLQRQVNHTILCVSSVDGTTKAEFCSVRDAAIYANVSTTHMYSKLRKRKWQRFSRSDFYVWSDELENLQRQVNHTILCVSSVDGTTKAEFRSVKDAAIYANVSTTSMNSKLQKSNWQPCSCSDFYVWSDELENLQRQVNLRPATSKERTTIDITHSITTRGLTLHVAGRAFPSENVLRGRRRSGGMAFSVSGFSREHWRKVVSSLWKGQKLQLLRDGKTLLLGYNYIRPSRKRCSLYGIREALRVARHFCQEDCKLHQQSTSMGTRTTDGRRNVLYNITIVTECNFCLDLLKNSTQLLAWGQWDNKEDFLTNGCLGQAQLLHLTNPDVLYPLARLVYRLCRENTDDFQVESISFKKATNDHLLGDAAQLAAKLMYDSVK